MSVLESVLYGFISGLAEFLPVSSMGHQAMLLRLFGVDSREPICDLLVHIAILLSLFVGCRTMLIRLRREQMIASRSRRSRTYDRTGYFDLRLVKTAAFPMIVCLLLYLNTARLESQPLFLALFFLLNGFFLIIPEYMRHGNKDSRSMTGLDGILIGIFSGLSALSGISRVGAGMSIASSRGADRHHSLSWALLLSIPAIVVLIIFDFIHIFTLGIGTISFAVIAGYFLSAGAAFCGGYLGISFVRFLTERTGFAGFAYYSWGTALFSFVLYLIA